MHTGAAIEPCASAVTSTQRYQRHRPEDSVLYALVEQHLPAFQLSLAERDRLLPGFALAEFAATSPAAASSTASSA